MSRSTYLNLKAVLISALFLWGIPFAGVFLVLGIVGFEQVIATQNIQVVKATLGALSNSPQFAWMAHLLYTIVAAILGYRLAKKHGNSAISVIWLAVSLAMIVHMSLHVLSGVPVWNIVTQFEYIRLPFMTLAGAFVGFHIYFFVFFNRIMFKKI